ncbi:tetratricopeptide repeat protein [Streptomyces sp. NPDC005931]|uniref:tetratricopeptide repeat protein n=1 Tax=Streptomyces sp. NPDC005931 TaxID=3364737 RepID=UPI0036BCF261
MSIRRGRDDNPVGAGLLVTPRQVLTCAHVVRPGTAPGVPTDPVYVQFQFARHHDPIAATVVPEGWHPAGGHDTGDIAVLELAGPAPAGAAPAPLRTTDPGTWDHRFRAYGYPKEHPREGVYARGEIIGQAGDDRLQVEASPHAGWALEQGFSGAPLWDMNSQGVVGILVARDSVGKVDRRTAYAIRVEALARYWPPLAAHVRDATTEETRGRLESLLWVPLTEEGEIPRVDQVDPYDIGVSRSKYSSGPDDAPYVARRQQDGELDAALADARFVVLAGRSKAGKSRTLYEALRRTLPGARLIVPRPDQPEQRVLDDLSRLNLPTGPDRSVLWLDDLHRFLQPGGLDLQILDRLARRLPALTVVATIPAKQRATLTAMENDVGRVSRTVLGKARTVELPSRLTPVDETVAQRLYPGEDFTARGIGELMVAAPALEQRFDDGAESCPAGWALVKAATDWLRMGMTEAVPEAALRELFDAYLSAHDPQSDTDDTLYRTGLAWAREPVAGSIALLHRVSGEVPAYAASPYLSEYLDTRSDDPSAAVPPLAWHYLAERQPPGELLRTAYVALTREESEVAERMFQQVARTTDDRDGAARASLMLGEMRLYQNDFEAAADLLGRAADSGVEDVVPLAQLDLAGVLMVTGERARARALLETAVASRDPQVSQMAQVGLARLLAAQGEAERAERLLEAVLAAGDTEVTPLAQTQLVRVLTGASPGVRAGRDSGRALGKRGTAARGGSAEPTEQPWALSRALSESIAGQITALASVGLGGIYAHQGRLDRAEELLKSAVDSGGYHATPHARSGLGELYLLQGRFAEAQRMFEAVLRSGHPLLVPTAQVALGIALLQQGDAETALPLLREVTELGHPDQGPRAACVLGEWYTAREDGPAAREWLEPAVESGHPDWSHTARVDLAVVLAAESDDMDPVRELLTEVIRSGHPEQVPRAADLLGELLALAGLPTEAEEAYRVAIDSGHREWTWIARINLASLLAAGEDGTAGARELLTQVMESDHPEQGPRAADLLGDLLAGAGRSAEAEHAYRVAIDSGHEEWSLIGRIDLALLLADNEQFTRAESLLRVVAESANATAVAWATTLLGMVHVHAGRRAEGLGHLREAGRTGEAPVAQMARFQLAKFLIEDGELDEARELLRSVVEDRPTDVTEAARAYLCVMLLREGDQDAAEELLLGVERSGDSEAIAVAYLGMGEHLLEIGELQAAGDLLEGALGVGTAETAPRAGALLGVLRRSNNDFEEARRLLSDALATGDPEVEPLARRYLGSTLFRMRLLRQAEETLLPLARSADTEHRPQALLLLAQVLVTDNRPEEAYSWFEEAIACGDPETESTARYHFAALLVDMGQRERAREVWVPEVSEEDGPAEVAPGPATASVAPAVSVPPAPAPHPLPAAVLALLGDVASAEGDEGEARYWYGLAGTGVAEAS